MSTRQSVYQVRRVKCDGGESPNNYVGQITVEVKAFWPPHTVDRATVIDILTEAYFAALVELNEAPIQQRKVWLMMPPSEA